MYLTTKKTKRRRRATTLVEYIVAAGVGSLVAMAVVPLTLYSGYNFATLANFADLNSTSLNTVDRMTSEIRRAAKLTSFSTTQIILDMGTNQAPLTYTYSPITRTLTREQGGYTKVLMREVDALQFAMYQRNPKPGLFEHYSTTNVSDGRVLTVKWNCSRVLFGNRVTSESLEAARIVLRKN